MAIIRQRFPVRFWGMVRPITCEFLSQCLIVRWSQMYRFRTTVVSRFLVVIMNYILSVPSFTAPCSRFRTSSLSTSWHVASIEKSCLGRSRDHKSLLTLSPITWCSMRIRAKVVAWEMLSVLGRQQLDVRRNGKDPNIQLVQRCCRGQCV